MSVTSPSTFLELVQRTRLECGISSGGSLGNVPTSIAEAAGIELLLVGWVVEAWKAIQRIHDNWHFMRQSTNFLTISGKSTYTPTECGVPDGAISSWQRETVRNFHTASGISSSMFMSELPYDDWRNQYLFGSLQSVRTRPTQFAVNPADHGLALGPVPNADYTVTADYFQSPITLVNDLDVPTLPSQHIMAIVYKAMMEYGEFDAAAETFSRGAKGYAAILATLERERLNQVVMGGALA